MKSHTKRQRKSFESNDFFEVITLRQCKERLVNKHHHTIFWRSDWIERYYTAEFWHGFPGVFWKSKNGWPFLKCDRLYFVPFFRLQQYVFKHSTMTILMCTLVSSLLCTASINFFEYLQQFKQLDVPINL